MINENDNIMKVGEAVENDVFLESVVPTPFGDKVKNSNCFWKTGGKDLRQK